MILSISGVLALKYFIHQIEEKYEITYDQFEYYFPAKLSFTNLAWNVDSVVSGQLDSLYVDVHIRKLLSGKTEVSELWLSGGGIILSQSQGSGSGELPNALLSRLNISDVLVKLESESAPLDLSISWLELRSLTLGKDLHLSYLNTRDLRAEISIPEQPKAQPAPQELFSLPALDGFPNFSIDTLQATELDVNIVNGTDRHFASLNLLLTDWSKNSDFLFSVDTLYGALGDSIPFNVRIDPSSWSSSGGINLPLALIHSSESSLELRNLKISAAAPANISLDLGDSYLAFDDIRQFYVDLDEIIKPEFSHSNGIKLHGKGRFGNSIVSLDSLFFNLGSSIPGSIAGMVNLGDSLKSFELHSLQLSTTISALKEMLATMPDLGELKQNEKVALFLTGNGNTNAAESSGRIESAAGVIEMYAKSEKQTNGTTRFDLKAGSKNLKIPRMLMNAENPVEALSFDLEAEVLKSPSSNDNDLKASLSIPRLQLKGQELSNINLDYTSFNDQQLFYIDIKDPYAELSAKGNVVQNDTLYVNWDAEVFCLQPSGYADMPVNWVYAGQLNGTVETKDEHIKSKLVQASGATISDTDTTFRLLPLYGDFVKAGESLLVNLTADSDNFIQLSTGKKAAAQNAKGWRNALNSLPEFHLEMKTHIDSTFGTTIFGAPLAVHIDELELDKGPNGHIIGRGIIPGLGIGLRETRDISFDLTYRDNYIRGFLNAGEIKLLDEPIRNTRIDIVDHSGFVIYSLKSDGIESFGETDFAIRQTDSPQYTELTIENNFLKILGETWQAKPGDRILFDRNWHLLSGLVELNNNAAFLRFSKTGDGNYTIGIDSVDVAYLLTFIGDSKNIAGELNGEITLNSSADSINVMLKTDQLSWNDYVIDQITLQGSYLNDLATARLEALSEGSVSWVDATYEEKVRYTGGFDNLNIGWINLLIPEDFKLTGYLNGNFHGAYPPEKEDGGMIYINKGLLATPFHRKPLTISSNPITASQGVVYANHFGLKDEYDHKLEVNGYFQFGQELTYNLDVLSDRFTLINNDKDDRYSGLLSASADVHIHNGPTGAVISGFADILPGGWFQLIQSDDSFTIEKEEPVVEFTSFSNEINEEVEEELTEVRQFIESAAIDIGIGSTEVEIVLNPISREFVKMKSEGKLFLNKQGAQEWSLSGRVYSTAGKAMVSLPIVPSLNMNINEVIVVWTGDPYLPLISFKGTEGFKSTLGGLPGFENRIGLVPVNLLISLKEVRPNNIVFDLGLETGDPQLKAYLDNQPAETIRSYAMNLLLFGKLSSDGETGSTMALNSVTKKLNELSQRNLKYTDLIFSVERGFAAAADGSEIDQTTLNYTLQRNLINNRLRVALDGDVGISAEGNNAAPSSHFIGNFSLSYQLAPNSPWSADASRRNRYAGVIDGEITQYQFGFRFGRSYPTVGAMFRKNPEPAVSIEDE
jgi:hypothetical protein